MATSLSRPRATVTAVTTIQTRPPRPHTQATIARAPPRPPTRRGRAAGTRKTKNQTWKWAPTVPAAGTLGLPGRSSGTATHSVGLSGNAGSHCKQKSHLFMICLLLRSDRFLCLQFSLVGDVKLDVRSVPGAPDDRLLSHRSHGQQYQTSSLPGSQKMTILSSNTNTT